MRSGLSDPESAQARPAAMKGRRSLQSPGEAIQPELPPPPPTPPRKRRPIVATASGILSFIVVLAIGSIVLLSMAAQRLHAPGPLPADKVVVIVPGTDVSGIIDQLQREGVIDSGALMTGALWIEGSRTKIKAGEYLFKQSASLREVIDTLVSGKQILHSITFPEGLTSEQMIDRMKEDEILVGDVKDIPKEGTLMPDTFKFARGTTREQLVHTMQQEQKRVVAEVWSHRAQDIPVKSPYEMLTLASIVEKETGRADERPRVAGVFVNRLLKNMPLQSDPTIVYGLVGGKGTLGRGILKSEIEQRTPYNTYAVTGLPPTPICNPGRAAMEAVANPSRTREIYFVADGTGGHAFAETLDQHRLNVQRWRQIEKDAKDKASPDADKILAPPATTPAGARPNQRGDLGPVVPVYGALRGGSFAAAAPPPGGRPNIAAMAAAMMAPNALPPQLMGDPRLVSTLQPIMTAGQQPPGAGPDGDGADTPIETAAVGPAAGSAEERALGYTGTDKPMLTFPVPAARRADEKAQAAQFGLSAGSDKLPTEAVVASTEPAAPPLRTASGRPRVFDASEGTPLDPLLDKTYDLNSPKVVPLVKPVATRPLPTSNAR